LTGSKEIEGKKANSMVDHMDKSKDFKLIEKSDVSSEANSGEIIIAGKKESSGSGHVALAVPGDQVKSGNWGGLAPLGMDTGRNNRWSKKGMNFSWGKLDGVKFYKFIGSSSGTIKKNLIDGGVLPEVTVTASKKPQLTPKPPQVVSLKTN